MQARGFFRSLFDFSFSSFITPRIIKILYVLMTILVTLWTLVVILLAFRASTAIGIVFLLIAGPLFFVITMIYVRVGLELLMAFFHIHSDVAEINRRGGATTGALAYAAPIPEPAPAASPEPPPEVATASPLSSAPAPAPPPATAFCGKCGAARVSGKRFCTSCGEPFD